MGAREFGRWVDETMKDKGLGPTKVAARIGELSDGRVFDATGIRLMRLGRRRDYDTELVTRIAKALGEDPLVACNIAGVEPPGYDLEQFRRFREAMMASASSSDPGIETMHGLTRRPALAGRAA
jgi:hypothetical protein